MTSYFHIQIFRWGFYTHLHLAKDWQMVLQTHLLLVIPNPSQGDHLLFQQPTTGDEFVQLCCVPNKDQSVRVTLPSRIHLDIENKDRLDNLFVNRMHDTIQSGMINLFLDNTKRTWNKVHRMKSYNKHTKTILN